MTIMLNTLYNIIIFPLIQIIEISFVIVDRIFDNCILSIIGVSITVSIITLPLYFIAEKWQNVERNIQAKLNEKVKKIKTVFKGDEQYLILRTYYKQNNYHPFFAFRNSLSVLIQIPFFIAAYYYLSNLEYLKGISFLFIEDLGSPDHFYSFGNFSINLLPILMFFVNCFSGYIYSVKFLKREKIQIYSVAIVFLILLYNSPSSLVLYWTMNNIFSLFKNILLKFKNPFKIIYILICSIIIILNIRFVLLGYSPKRIFVVVFFSIFLLLPFFKKLYAKIKNYISTHFIIEESSISFARTYIYSVITLFIIAGIFIPSSLIASSVQEFSYLENYTTPFPFIIIVCIQSLGTFLFWPLCIYFLFPKKYKSLLSLLLSLLCIISIVNIFLFSGNYGFMTTTFTFSNPDTFESNLLFIFSNLFIIFLICIMFFYLLLIKRRYIFNSLQLIMLSFIILLSITNIFKIIKDYNSYSNIRNNTDINSINTNKINYVYNFTKYGRNVIVIMIDSAISGFVPYIFDEKPELLESFTGFTYYPNCVSYGNHTRIGAPLIFGGYEYQPKNIQKNRSFAMQKHNEALLMMPLLFSKEGYHIVITEPTFANYSLKPDLSIFSSYPEIMASNIQGNYTNLWLESHPELNVVSIPQLLNDILLRFSFFKISPPAFRIFLYDKGRWLKPDGLFSNNMLSLSTLDCYTTLYYFPQLTEISDANYDTYTAIVNDLTHNPSFFQFPDYEPSIEITDYGNGQFSDDKDYHSNIAVFILLGKWLNFLQEQGVYDNTRIIIVSDHGHSVECNYSGNMKLINDEMLSMYHPLLLIKDFNKRGKLLTDFEFMTHGDVPSIAMKNLINNPINPFSGIPVITNKESGAMITTSNVLQYKISKDQWLLIQKDIFDFNNWEKVEFK